MRRVVLALALLSLACGPARQSSQQASAAAASNPAPTPATVRQSLGVLVSHHSADSPSASVMEVRLIGLRGQVLARASAAVPLDVPDLAIPRVSTSTTRAYYLDGGADVHYLDGAGNTGFVTRLKLAAGISQAGFAVSPDDKRIAVSVLRYNPAPPGEGPRYPPYLGMSLYVEDLYGGGNHVELFNSPTVSEWPVGWTSGQLILGVSIPHTPQQGLPNPAGAANGYHVADASNGDRKAEVCANRSDSPYSWPAGLPTADGTLCVRNSGIYAAAWDGGERQLSPSFSQSYYPYLGALAPSGGRAIIAGDPMYILDRAGRRSQLHTSGAPEGWLDGSHVLFRPLVDVTATGARLASGARYPNFAALSIVDLESGGVVALDSGIDFVGHSLYGVIGSA